MVVPLYSEAAKLDGWEVVRTLGPNLFLRNRLPPSDAFAANPLPNAVNGSLWSIPFDVWCYVGVVTLGAVSLATRGWFLVGLLMTVMLARVALDLLGLKPSLGAITLVFGSPYLWVCILPSFLLGMAAFALRDPLPRSRPLLALVVGTAIAASRTNEHLAHLVVAPALAYALFYVAFSRRLALPDLARYGDCSYGMYLYAFPIQQILFAEFGSELSLPMYLLASLACRCSRGRRVGAWWNDGSWHRPGRPCRRSGRWERWGLRASNRTGVWALRGHEQAPCARRLMGGV